MSNDVDFVIGRGTEDEHILRITVHDPIYGEKLQNFLDHAERMRSALLMLSFSTPLNKPLTESQREEAAHIRNYIKDVLSGAPDIAPTVTDPALRGTDEDIYYRAMEQDEAEDQAAQAEVARLHTEALMAEANRRTEAAQNLASNLSRRLAALMHAARPFADAFDRVAEIRLSEDASMQAHLDKNTVLPAGTTSGDWRVLAVAVALNDLAPSQPDDDAEGVFYGR